MTASEAQEDKYKNFSRKLRKVLHERKLTCADLSGLTRISRASISKYVNGHQPPGYNHLYSICIALGVTPNYLMGIGGEDNETDSD